MLNKLKEKNKKLKELTRDLRNKIEALESEYQKNNASSGKLNDGKYEGVGVGFRGKLKVEVEVKDGKIATVNVLENVDDPPYFEKAKALIESIISKQTTEVDAISKATYSSNGIKSAVRDALKKAVSTQGS